MLKILLPVLLAAPLAACDSQVDSDHQGTALARLSGTIRNLRTQTVGDAEVAAGWYNSAVEKDLESVEPVQVTGNFPAHFTLSVYTPPDPLFLNTYPDGSQVGIATIAAAKAGTDFSLPIFESNNLLGAEIEHLLVYVPVDVAEGTFASFILHSTPRAGFHVYQVRRLSDSEQAAVDSCIRGLVPPGELPTPEQVWGQCGGESVFDWLEPLETDLNTELQIDLVDDPRSIDLPNWT